MRRRRWLPALQLLAICLLLTMCTVACASPAPLQDSTVDDPTADADAAVSGLGDDISDDAADGDAATNGADATDADDDAGSLLDASFDDVITSDAAVCPSAIAPGDLAITELMISSVAGSGDYGEWLEVESARDCVLDLLGLHGESPHGATPVTFDVTDDVMLPPRGSFVVADSADGAINHDLPGFVIAWSGAHGDVLRNQGETIDLRMDGQLIDSVTYPALKLTIGASIAFPADCAAAERTVLAHWKTSTASWFPAFFGTPNAPNTDVRCN
jgi:hypothetical protein